MACAHGSTIGRFSLMFSPLATCPHGFALGSLFDYEDESHVIIVTNLNENVCNLNMKVADFKRTNMLAFPSIWRRCRQLKGGGHVTVATNLKKEVILLLPPTWRKPTLPIWKRRLCTIATNIKIEVILSFLLWSRMLPTGRRRVESQLMLTGRMRWTIWKRRPHCH